MDLSCFLSTARCDQTKTNQQQQKKRSQAALGLKTLPEEAPWACKRSANQLKRANRLKHPQPGEDNNKTNKTKEKRRGEDRPDQAQDLSTYIEKPLTKHL